MHNTLTAQFQERQINCFEVLMRDVDFCVGLGDLLCAPVVA